jgi:RNA polymerase sigma-70 factor (ECF subfamily)
MSARALWRYGLRDSRGVGGLRKFSGRLSDNCTAGWRERRFQKRNPHVSRLARRLQDELTMAKTASAFRMTRVSAFPAKVTDNHSSARAGSTDLGLVARLRAGEEAALTELVRRYHGALLRLALVLLPNRAIAEEVVQDTWACVVDGLDSFEGRSTLKTWICRILTNRAKTRLIREARSVSFSALRDSDSDEPAVDPARFSPDGRWAEAPRRWNHETPEKLFMQKEAMGCLERALQELPAAQRAVVTLRDVEGLESDEVCNVLGIGETNQRVLLHRGRSKLRRALEEHLIGA